MDGDLQDDPKNFLNLLKKDNKTCLFGLVPSDNHKGYFLIFFGRFFIFHKNK